MDTSLDTTQGRPQPSELAADPAQASSVTVAALDNRGVAKAALIVMFFFVISRVLGLARVAIIGARFGTSAEYDAYLAAFSLPDLLFQLVAGGALGSAFIPTFSKEITWESMFLFKIFKTVC